MSEPVYELAELTWQEAEDVLRRRPIGLLPVGAIEAHGPHLPLETDVIIAREMAKRGARLLAGHNLPVLILPVMSFGVSFVGTCFGGTSPVDVYAFEANLTSLLTHAATQEYRALCVCNAHLEPAHVAAIQRAARTASSDTGIPIVAPDKREPRWAERLSEEFRRGARHAGGYETSLMLAVSPSAVRWDEARKLPPVWVDLPAQLSAGAKTFAEAGGELGYFGEPATASANEGERLFDALGTIIRDAVLEALEVDCSPTH
ncbi:MAG: creatininase family protein [Nitrolancea sp.]